jgi:hypothetical protein
MALILYQKATKLISGLKIANEPREANSLPTRFKAELQLILLVQLNL